MVYTSVTQLIGGTPLMRLVNYERLNGVNATLLAKLEYLNPAGSVKDRVAYAMIKRAENSGLLKPKGVIIEPTSGNTGIAVSAVAASLGYKAIIVMPGNMSAERKLMMQAYGARVVLTPADRGMQGAIEEAEKLSKEIDGVILGQFGNPANPDVHSRDTGAEIYKDARGKVDIFVAGVGTGGTLSGVGGYLKSKNRKTTVVAVEPAGSPFLSQGRAGSHAIQGIGAGFAPQNLDAGVYDEVMTVTDAEAFSAMKKLCRTEGLFVGISSGAAVRAAALLAARPENYGKTIVTLLPDSADRYMSLFG